MAPLNNATYERELVIGPEILATNEKHCYTRSLDCQSLLPHQSPSPLATGFGWLRQNTVNYNGLELAVFCAAVLEFLHKTS